MYRSWKFNIHFLRRKFALVRGKQNRVCQREWKRMGLLLTGLWKQSMELGHNRYCDFVTYNHHYYCVFKGYGLSLSKSMIEEEENEMNEYLKKKVATIPVMQL